MIILKVTKNQSFTLSLEDTFFEKPQGRGQIDPRAVFGLIVLLHLECGGTEIVIMIICGLYPKMYFFRSNSVMII